MPEYGPQALPTSVNGRNGLWVPEGWGTGWRSAKAAAGSRLVNVVGWGDSILFGAWASSLATMSLWGKLLTDLQALYGDGGSGFISVGEVAASIGRVTATGSLGAYGGWDSVGAGINHMGLTPHASSNGATLTFTVRGTAVDIYWLGTASSHFTYNIDAAGAVDVNTTGTGSIGKTTVTGLSAGSHSVVITANTNLPVIYGVTGRNANGIIGHNMSRGGRLSSEVAGAAASGLAASATTGRVSLQDFCSPDLFIPMISFNDAAFSGTGPGVYSAAAHTHTSASHTHTENTAASYTQNATTAATAPGAGQSVTPGLTAVRGAASYVRQACEYARAANSACDIVIVVQNPGKTVPFGGANDSNYYYQDYAHSLHMLARSFNAAVLDCWALGRNSYDYWTSLGYWGSGVYDGAAGSDTVHPSNAGHAAIEAQLLSALTP